MSKHTRALQICLIAAMMTIMTAFTVSASSAPPHEGEEFAGWALNGDEENLYDAGTEMKTDKADDNYTMRLKAVYKVPNPTAVLYNDGTLIFYEDTPDPADDITHSGIANVYPASTGWPTEVYREDTSVPWYSQCYDITAVQFKGTVKPKSLAYWFSGCFHLKTVISDGLDTRNVKNMRLMFSYCRELENISGMDTWDTSHVTDMGRMFEECEKISELNINSWDVNNVTNMSHMFWCCSELIELNIGDWDISNVNDMTEMFYDCEHLQKLDLSNWYPINIKNIANIFYRVGYNSAINKTSIIAQDWTSNQNIKKAGKVFNDTQIFEGEYIDGSGAFCKPQSMGGYFTDPQ